MLLRLDGCCFGPRDQLSSTDNFKQILTAIPAGAAFAAFFCLGFLGGIGEDTIVSVETTMWCNTYHCWVARLIRRE